MTGEEKAIIFCVPEDCLFDTVDKSMAIFPNDAVSFMVSEHDYLLLETKCKQQREAIEVLMEGLNKVVCNPYIQYGHGKNSPVSELTHQYKMGVTDGHRLARTWADEALNKAKEIRGEDG